MSKKLFVLILVSMLLVTLSVLVLTLTGHEQLIAYAMDWVAHSASNALKVLGTIGVVLLVLLVTSS